MDPGAGRTGVDDRAARLLLTPVLGVLVPNLAGIIDHGHHTTASLAASYAWFTMVALITWEGNLRLYLRFQDRTAWLTQPWHRVRLLVGLICLFTVPFVAVALGGWALVTDDPAATWRRVAMAVLLVVSAVIFITHVYETVFLVREWESDRLRSERLQREKVEAELDALRSEVDPHTLFNNLNVLSHLVEQDSPRTADFIEALARSHRYLLEVRGRRLVTVSEELSLLDHFVMLIGIRYGDGLRVELDADPAAARRWLIPPVTLPELLQNAAKHNEISRASPLGVTIRLEGDRLLVSNERRSHPQEASGTGLGLENLARRFRLLTGTPARWGVNGSDFVVTLPLVPVGPA
ncbi:MAG: sensor histidine kinase [Vicinamibacterales bacterium]